MRDHPLTPRIETWENGVRFSNLHDLAATAAHATRGQTITFDISTRLLSATQATPAAGPVAGLLKYIFKPSGVMVRAQVAGRGDAKAVASLVLPLISSKDETVRRISDRRIEIVKPRGRVIVEANAPLRIQVAGQARIFNLVPGFEAVPIVAELPSDPRSRLECRLRVERQR